MLMSDIASKLNLTKRVDGAQDVDVTRGYASDLLSDVLANAKASDVWVTNQKHQNCVAVASLLGLAAMVIAGGIEPDDNTMEKAVAEQVALYTSNLPLFEVVGRMYELGVKG